MNRVSNRWYIVFFIFIIGCASLTSSNTRKLPVLVWDLKNDNPVLQEKLDLGKLLAARVNQILNKSRGYYVINHENVTQVLEELALGATLIDKSELFRIGNIFGAKYMIFGGYSILENQIQINLSLIDVETTAIVKFVQKTSKVNDPKNQLIIAEQMVQELSEQLAQDLLLYPNFPWSPPKASATFVIPDKLIRKSSHREYSLSDVNDILTDSLSKCGYSEKSYFAILDGFVIVTRLEQINPDGSPKEKQVRWVAEFEPTMDFSIWAYIKALIKGRIGHYRVIAFAVSPKPFKQKETLVTSDQANAWNAEGLNKLPKSIGQKLYTAEYNCTALIYEFEKTELDKEATIRIPSKISARSHLEKSNILFALEQR